MASLKRPSVDIRMLLYLKYFSCIVPFLFSANYVAYYIIHAPHQHFSMLAKAFLHGRLSFLTVYEQGIDAVFFHGQYFWPLGPFPAVLLIPFVWLSGLFHAPFHEAYLHLFIFAGIFYLWYRIAKKLKYYRTDALYLTYAFCFSSTLLSSSVSATSWHFAHLITVLLLTLSLYEYLTRRRWLLIGMFCALTLATRLTAGLGIIFFALTIITEKSAAKDKVKPLIKLFLPFAAVFIILLFYNFARFGSFLEQGYGLQILSNPALIKARSYGIFSLVHVPGNLYYFLLAAPIPVFRDALSHVLRFPYLTLDAWGLGLFITSPYYLYLFLLRNYDRTAKLLWVTMLAIAIPIFCYYGVGYIQYGYRYALDFLPFLFFLLIRNYQRQFGELSKLFKLMIIFGCIWNIYLLAMLPLV
jgi:hypothetical protein